MEPTKSELEEMASRLSPEEEAEAEAEVDELHENLMHMKTSELMDITGMGKEEIRQGIRAGNLPFEVKNRGFVGHPDTWKSCKSRPDFYCNNCGRCQKSEPTIQELRIQRDGLRQEVARLEGTDVGPLDFIGNSPAPLNGRTARGPGIISAGMARTKPKKHGPGVLDCI